MGDPNVQNPHSASELRAFTRQLLREVRAFDRMLADGRFASGHPHIGAEQELAMVDANEQAAPIIQAVLARKAHPEIVSEITRFSVEFGTDPILWGDRALSTLESRLSHLLGIVQETVRAEGADVVMTGILPTLTLSDITRDAVTPEPRYFAIDEAIQNLRGDEGFIQIRGVDELYLRHQGVLLEGCNTSFQTHFQVDPQAFPQYYNAAQLVAAPVLAAAANSPLLFGRRLWHETRIALFQQAVDTRTSHLHLRELSPRVHFGSDWVRDSVTEIYREDIARFRVILTPQGETENPFDVLARGDVPSMRALSLHNGTVYRWNRPVYGVSNGQPTLRIENRILPAGPTVADEVANAAFWFGLVSGLVDRFGDVRPRLHFDEVKSNFFRAAREGLGAELCWLDGSRMSATELILDHLLPLARTGLDASGIDEADSARYLGIIRSRVKSGRNGARWQLDSLAALRASNSRASRSECLAALVTAMRDRQASGAPVHTWPLATHGSASYPKRARRTRVEHVMTTDLFTTHQDEPVDLVAAVMEWQRIRHVLVEDEHHQLLGLVAHSNVLAHFAGANASNDASVRDIMTTNPITIGPEATTHDAIRLMRKHNIGSLPVVRDEQLIGIVTERDFIELAAHELERMVDA